MNERMDETFARSPREDRFAARMKGIFVRGEWFLLRMEQAYKNPHEAGWFWGQGLLTSHGHDFDSRPCKDHEVQDAWQRRVVGGQFQGLALVGLREPEQSTQFVPSQRLGCCDVVGGDVDAPAEVVQLEDP